MNVPLSYLWPSRGTVPAPSAPLETSPQGGGSTVPTCEADIDFDLELCSSNFRLSDEEELSLFVIVHIMRHASVF